ADEGERDDRRARRHRQAREAGAEVDQGVAIAVQLGGAARALREHHEEPLRLEQPGGVLRKAGEVAEPAGPDGGERHPVEELLRHPLGQARRLELEEDRRQHHAAVERDPAGVVADQHGAAARRHVLDAGHRDLEVAAVEQAQEAVERAQVPARDAERIDAVVVERDLEALEARLDLRVDEERHQTWSPSGTTCRALSPRVTRWSAPFQSTRPRRTCPSASRAMRRGASAGCLSGSPPHRTTRGPVWTATSAPCFSLRTGAALAPWDEAGTCEEEQPDGRQDKTTRPEEPLDQASPR